jgi:hypothetical protein
MKTLGKDSGMAGQDMNPIPRMKVRNVTVRLVCSIPECYL